MELIVKIKSNGSNPRYQDGDIVSVMSFDRIHLAHAEMICHPNNFGFNTNGTRDLNTLLEKFQQATHIYKFERLNSNDVKRTNLLTNEEDILNTIPNADGEAINVYKYISRRLKSPRHKIFGPSGGEVWYGKIRNDKEVFLPAVWNHIETETDNLKDDHNSWPFTDLEKRHFVCINTSGRNYDGGSFTRVELSGGTVTDRALPALEDPPEDPPEDYESVFLAKRKWFVPYWDLSSELGSSVDDLRDPDHMCDCRKPMGEREHIDILTYDKIVEGLL
jgi:hypothetical protein